MTSRRTFLAALVASAAAPALRSLAKAQSRRSIDRESLIQRHNPINTQIDPLSALSLGNGKFTFTADVTGLQTLEQEYQKAMPIFTNSSGRSQR